MSLRSELGMAAVQGTVGVALTGGYLACINPSNSNKLAPAADTSGFVVAGVATRDAAVGEVVGCARGIFGFKNSASHAFTKASVGKLAYVEDSETVSSSTTYHIIAGTIVDVLTVEDGSVKVFVNVGVRQNIQST